MYIRDLVAIQYEKLMVDCWYERKLQNGSVYMAISVIVQ